YEAERQGIAHVDAAHAVRRADDRDPVFLRELGQLAAALRERHAVADEDHRTARGLQQVERFLHVVGRRAAAALGRLPRRLERDLGLFLEQVEWHVEVHRPGPAARRGGDRLAHREREHVDAGRLEAALHDRADDVREVGLVVAGWPLGWGGGGGWGGDCRWRVAQG